MRKMIEFEFLGNDYLAQVEVRYRRAVVNYGVDEPIDEIDEVYIEWISDEDGNYIDVTPDLRDRIEEVIEMEMTI